MRLALNGVKKYFGASFSPSYIGSDRFINYLNREYLKNERVAGTYFLAFFY